MADETPKSDDLNLTAIIQALSAEELSAPTPLSTPLDAPLNAPLGAAAAGFDPNATVDYASAGEQLPELPFAKDAKRTPSNKSAQAKAAAAGVAPTGATKAKAGVVQTGSAAAAGAGTGAAGTAAGTAGARAASTAAAAAGAGAAAASAKTAKATRTTKAAAAQAAPTQTAQAGAAHTKQTAQAAQQNVPSGHGKTRTRTGNTGSLAAGRTGTGNTGSLAAGRTRTGNTGSLGTTRTPARSGRSTETRSIRNPLDGSDFSSAASSYRPINIHNSTYRIRGGGGFRFRSPVVAIIAAALALCGIGILGFGLSNMVGMLAHESGGTTIELTATQTRTALDGHLPLLANYLDASMDDTLAQLSESGQFITANNRYRPDSPDPTAQGVEAISTPSHLEESLLQGFFEGAYNAYSPEELSQYFNGAYVLDMARGELGSWDKLKFVNFNAASIGDEISHLAEKQGLTGAGVEIAAQGTDARGNTVMQGFKRVAIELVNEAGEPVAGERQLFFKIAACPFSDIYNAQKLTGSGVFVTLTLATYDFYTNPDDVIK